MKENQAFTFIKTTVMGGLLFLVPVVFLIFIFSEAMGFMLVIAEPMAKWLPIDTIADVVLANMIAIAFVILICFIAGLVGRNAMASGLVKKLESKVLMNIPAYTLIKGIKSGFDKDESNAFKPVALMRGTTERIGLEIQQLADGRSVVFLPSAPNSFSGFTQIVPAEEITYLDVPVTEVVDLSKKFGFGVDELLAKKISADPSTK